MVDQVDVVAIDRIFSTSAQLDSNAIVHFVTHLCNVSREELESATDPQVYGLQKIVEVAYYNMSRVRLVWALIWEVLGDFFTEVGQHANLSIAMYAVDSLRQLAAKFLEKGELLNYQFQREFLKPFEDLMTTAQSLEIKDLILGCLGHMMQSRAKSIRSGWRSLFRVFELAAADASPAISGTGFELVQRTVSDEFELLTDHHSECIACVCAYVRQEKHEAVALRGAEYLALYAKLLHERPPPTAAPAASATATEGDEPAEGGGGGSAAEELSQEQQKQAEQQKRATKTELTTQPVPPPPGLALSCLNSCYNRCRNFGNQGEK